MTEEITGAPDDEVVTATPSRERPSPCWDSGAAFSLGLLSLTLRVAGVPHQPYGDLCLLRCGVRGGIVQSRPPFIGVLYLDPVTLAGLAGPDA